MTHGEIATSRYHAATQALWPGRLYALRPAAWRQAARALTRCGPVEVRVAPGALAGLDAGDMLAASALRDAGIDLALSGAGPPEHLRWLRLLPWSSVIAHPALLRPQADRRRVVDNWAEAARRRGLSFVAPLPDRSRLAELDRAGFTHGEVAHADV